MTEQATSRSLPETADELDKAVKPYKLLVRPVIQGLSRVTESLGSEKFDPEEIESGVTAFAALAYQERAELNAYWLCGLWAVSTGAPRIIKAFADAEDRKAAREKDAMRLVDSARAAELEKTA